MGFRRGDPGMSAPGGSGFNLTSLSTSLTTLDIPDHRYIKTDTAEIITAVMKFGTSAISLPLVAGVNPEMIKQIISPNNHTTSNITFLK